MAKRIAEKELTDRNWDQEDEVEEVKAGGGEEGVLLFVLTLCSKERRFDKLPFAQEMVCFLRPCV